MIDIKKNYIDIENTQKYKKYFDTFFDLERKSKKFNSTNSIIPDDNGNPILLEYEEEKSLIYLLNLSKSVNLLLLLSFDENKKIFNERYEEYISLTKNEEVTDEDFTNIKKNFNMNYSEKEKNKKRISYENRNFLSNIDIKIIFDSIEEIKNLLSQRKELDESLSQLKDNPSEKEISDVLKKFKDDKIISSFKGDLPSLNNFIEEYFSNSFFKIIDNVISRFNKINPTFHLISELEENLFSKNSPRSLKVSLNDPFNNKDKIKLQFDLFSYNKFIPKNISLLVNNNEILKEKVSWNDIQVKTSGKNFTCDYVFGYEMFKWTVDVENISNPFDILFFNDDKMVFDFKDEIKNLKVLVNDEERSYKIYKENLFFNDEVLEVYKRNHYFSKRVVDILVKFNMRLIISQSKKFYNKGGRGLDFNELKNEGVLGFINAIHRFELNSDLKISTYSTWWINQLIGLYINRNKSSVVIPIRYTMVYNNYKSFIEKLENDDEKRHLSSDLDYIREGMGVSISKLKSAIFFTKNRSSISIYQTNSDNDEFSLCDLLTYQNDQTSEELVFETQIKELLKERVSQLNEKEKFVLMERQEVFNENPKTLEELGKKLDLTKERIRQIEFEALKKMKRILSDYFADLYF